MLRGRSEIEALHHAAKAVCGDTRGDNRATDLAGLALAVERLSDALLGIERLLADWPDEGENEFVLRSRNGRLLATFPTRSLRSWLSFFCPGGRDDRQGLDSWIAHLSAGWPALFGQGSR